MNIKFVNFMLEGTLTVAVRTCQTPSGAGKVVSGVGRWGPFNRCIIRSRVGHLWDP